MRPLFLLGLALAATGCLDRMIVDGTLQSTREASLSFDTLSDLEVARSGAGATLVQVEGLQRLSPQNADARFLLLKSWTGYAQAFIEDEWEQAVDRGDDDAETAQATRAREAYERAIANGTALLERRLPGFAAATRNADTIKAYLAAARKDDAELLLWLGAAWLSRGLVAAERTDLVSELFVGVALLEKSVELDPTLAYGTALAALGAYHARSPDAELGQAKSLFEQALAQTGRKALLVQVLYAQSWACRAHDEKAYRALLGEVLEAGDVLPAQRLENTVARRKAARFLGAPRLARCGFTP